MIGSNERWSVWSAFVRFQDKPEGKNRPIVMLCDDGKDCQFLPITSKVKDEVHYYRLIHWKSANLKVPSSVKLNIIKESAEIITERIGKLDNEDIKNLMVEIGHASVSHDD